MQKIGKIFPTSVERTLKFKNKSKSYYDFWNEQGAYGKERIKRYQKRKEKRQYLRERRTLCKCGHNTMSDELHSCPFDEDMNGDYSKNCRCCSSCEHECAMDI